MSAIDRLFPRQFQAVLEEIGTEALWAFAWTMWGFVLASIFGVGYMQFGLIAPIVPVAVSTVVLIVHWNNRRSFRIRSLAAFVIGWIITALAVHFALY